MSSIPDEVDDVLDYQEMGGTQDMCTQEVFDYPDDDDEADEAGVKPEIEDPELHGAGPSSSSDTGAGNKRSTSEVQPHLDEPASGKLPKTEAASGNRMKPKKMEAPGRLVATSSTVALTVTMPDDNGSPIDRLEVEYFLDSAKKSTRHEIPTNGAAGTSLVMLGLDPKFPLGLSSRISAVKIRAHNVHGWALQFSPAAFTDKEYLCCSPLTATVDELTVAFASAVAGGGATAGGSGAVADGGGASADGGGSTALKRVLSKHYPRPQLNQLWADLGLHIKTSAKNYQVEDQIVAKCAELGGGSNGAARVDLLQLKQAAMHDAKAAFARVSAEHDGRKANIAECVKTASSAQEAVGHAETAQEHAVEALKKAQKDLEDADRTVRQAQEALHRAQSDQRKGEGELEKKQGAVQIHEAQLAHAQLVEMALQAAVAAPPPKPPALVDMPMGGSSSDLNGNAMPPPASRMPSCGFSKVALKNRIKKWMEVDSGIKAPELKRLCKECGLKQYSSLAAAGLRDMLVPEKQGCETVAKVLRAPESIYATEKLVKLYAKFGLPPPGDGTNRATMVDEISMWLLQPAQIAAKSELAPSTTLIPRKLPIDSVGDPDSPKRPPKRPDAFDLLIVACSPGNVQSLPHVARVRARPPVPLCRASPHACPVSPPTHASCLTHPPPMPPVSLTPHPCLLSLAGSHGAAGCDAAQLLRDLRRREEVARAALEVHCKAFHLQRPRRCESQLRPADPRLHWPGRWAGPRRAASHRRDDWGHRPERDPRAGLPQRMRHVGSGQGDR